METFESKADGANQKKYAIFLALLLCVNFWWLLGTKISDLLLDFLVAEFSGTPDSVISQIQIYDSIYNYIVAIFVIIFGILVDRFPGYRKMLLILTNVLWIFTDIVLITVPLNFTMYLIAQIGWGIAIGANGPIIFSYLGDLFRINFRGRLFSIFAFVLYLIKGSSNVVTGLIGEYFASWRAPLVVSIIGSGIAIVFFFFIAKEPKLAEIEPEFLNSNQIATGYNYRLNLKEIKTIIKQRTNMLFLIQGFFGTIGVVLVTRYLFYWLTSSQKDGLGLSSLTATFLLGISGGIGAIIGIFFTGHFADSWFNRGRLDKMLYFAIACIFFQVFVYALLVFIPNYPDLSSESNIDIFGLLTRYPEFWKFVVIFNFCLLAGTSIGPVVGTTRTHINLPEHRATAAALYDTTDFIGGGTALLFGSLLSLYLNSFKLIIFFGSLAWLISGTIWLMITKNINQDYRNIREILKSRAETDREK